MTRAAKPLRILHVVGARPNFMKVAPVHRALAKTDETDQLLVHTGQHYDPGLSEDLFEDLDLPRPNVNLGVGSGSHAEQTGRVLMALEPVLLEWSPDWVFTVGDVNSTLAAALVAAKLHVPVAHVEAGLRSGDRDMPEEINRLVTDRLSRALFTTEPSANENLIAEGIPSGWVHYVGNVMIDTLDRLRDRAESLHMPERLGLQREAYILVTLHRPGNVDDSRRLAGILRALGDASRELKMRVVIPLHPRTHSRIDKSGLQSLLADWTVLPALRYLEFLGVLQDAAVVVTDSGGIQEETTVLGVPCVTLRNTTERPVTVTEGTNRLFTDEIERLPAFLLECLKTGRRPVRPHLWDGAAAERIAEITLRLGCSPLVTVRGSR